MWVIISVMVLFFVWYWWRNNEERKTLPPGPNPWPIVGNLFQLDPAAPDQTIAKWAKEYGALFTIWIPRANVIIADFELIKEAFIRQGDVFSGRYAGFVFQVHANEDVPTGIILGDGPRWKQQRRFALHVLRNFGFGRNIMEAKIMHETEKFIEFLNQEISSNGVNSKEVTLDLEHQFHLCVGNIINQVLMGKAFGKDDPKFYQLKNIIENQLKNVQSLKMLLLDSYPWLRFVPFWEGFGYHRYLNNGKEIENFFKTQVHEHKTEFQIDQEPTDFCHAYLQEIQRRKINKESSEWFSEGQLCSIMGDLWAAGMETTVTTLRWGIIYMMIHPEIQQKVHEEIDQIIGMEKQISMSDKAIMPYTTATVAEIQRKANILPLNLQHRTLETTTIGNYQIPKNTTVIGQIGTVHMDPKVFPEAEKFKPERFLNEKGQFQTIEQLAPFSLGKRQCLGESLARMELFLIFTTLMQKFTFSIPHNQSPPSLKPIVGITLVPRHYDVTIIER